MKPNYEIVVEESTDDILVIRDVGPWDKHLTVTNDVGTVVLELAEKGLLPEGRRLLYYDSDNGFDEIVVTHGRFAGFRPGPGKRCFSD